MSLRYFEKENNTARQGEILIISHHIIIKYEQLKQIVAGDENNTIYSIFKKIKRSLVRRLIMRSVVMSTLLI